MNATNCGELAANAARALERYREQMSSLSDDLAAVNVHRDALITQLAMIREFIAALTAAPRPARKPRAIEAVDPPEAPQQDMDAA